MQTPKLPKNLPTKNVNLVQIAAKCKPTLFCFLFTKRWRQQKKRNGRSMRCVWIVFVVVFFRLTVRRHDLPASLRKLPNCRCECEVRR